MQKNKSFLIEILILQILFLMCITSCSYNFEAGLSGNIYSIDGKTGIENVIVYAYTSESDRDNDFANYTFNPENPSIPIASRCNFRTKTDNNGAFSVNKIVWNSSRSVWGKDNDVCTVYLWYYNDDIGAVKSQNTIRIVSGSKNDAAVTEKLNRLYYTIPSSSVSGNVRTSSSTTSFGIPDDDNAELELYYYDNDLDSWKGVYTDLGRECGKVKTTVSTVGSSSTVILENHGNYTALGQNTRFKLTLDTDNKTEYILLAIKLVSHKSGTNVGNFAPSFKITTEEKNKTIDYLVSDFVNTSPL